MEIELHPLLDDESNKKKIEVRIVFQALHEIDTMNERFTAEIYIEGRWRYDKDYSEETQTPFVPVWKPNLQISNLITEHKSETWYKLGRNNDGIYAFEMKLIKGVFYEKLELHNYPFDTQKLSIKIVSSHNVDVCYLTSNPVKMSNIVTNTFRDSQEWRLFHYVRVDEGLTDTSTKHSLNGGTRSQIKFSCLITRAPTYFIWNAFFLVFLISAVSFSPFSLSILTAATTRIQMTLTLMLTSVSFKWVINRNVPAISYLTTLDVYSIFGISWVAVLCALHSLHGHFYKVLNNPWIDIGFLITMTSIFVLINLIFILYLIIHIYKPRRNCKRLERDFQERQNENKIEVAKNQMNFIF